MRNKVYDPFRIYININLSIFILTKLNNNRQSWQGDPLHIFDDSF